MPEALSHWSPKEVRKTITLIAGIVLFFVGIYVMCNQTKAEGTIDLKFLSFNGKITSSCAGLFICVIAGGLIVFANLSGKTSNKTIVDKFPFLKEKKFANSMLIIALVLILIAVFIFFPATQPIVIFLIAILAIALYRILTEMK